MSAMCLLLIACMSISLVACNGDDTKKPGPDETECTVHVDADTNGECDKCGEPVEIVEPGTDDPAIDVVTDVPNAVKLFNFDESFIMKKSMQNMQTFTAKCAVKWLESV